MASPLTDAEYRRIRKTPVECVILREKTVESLSDYFAVVDSLTSEEVFWFRGHGDLRWRLQPSALRYPGEKQRSTACGMLGEFRRIAELKIRRPPAPNERLKWVQLAQHYGLPTRLLDWTESATVGLYFACLGSTDRDGILFSLNPLDLNALGPAKSRRLLTAQDDTELIEEYLSMTGRSQGRRGRAALAISPVWNSQRLILQRGAFTLHGARFDLDRDQAPSLVGIPILREVKSQLRRQLSRIGVDRLTIFPELEHTGAFLRGKAEGVNS